MGSLILLIAVCLLIVAAKAALAQPDEGQKGVPPPLNYKDQKNPATKPKRYRVKKSILTAAELKFHNLLTRTVPEAPILPKMRMADVIDTEPGTHITDFRRISQKHFDWVICHPITLEPLLAIELDDSSHSWSRSQIKNDTIKNNVTQEAGLNLLRINWQRDYDETKVRDQIAEIINRIADEKDQVS